MKRHSLMILLLVLMTVTVGFALARKQPKTLGQADELLLNATLNQDDPQALARDSGCLKCHGVDEKVVGPPYRAVAERYKQDPRARKTLYDSVKNGSKGKWSEVTGDASMPPHSASLSKSDIERLVDWVLSFQAK